MQTDLNYLPTHKQAELSLVVDTIRKTTPVEMIILFGSYARNDWVEEKYDDVHYRYQSDYDVLVIVATKSLSKQEEYELAIESEVRTNAEIKTPLTVIVHDIEFVNRRLKKAQYFFSDIKKEGVLLYDSGKYHLSAAKELLPEERKKLAQDYFDYYFGTVEKLSRIFKFALSEKSHSEAAFLLHQVTERLYSGILLALTNYKPNTHDLYVLRYLTNSVDSRFMKVFPLQDGEECRLFKLLKKAYIDARYNPNYKITEDELNKLSHKVDELTETGKIICCEKIDGFAS